MSTLRPNPNDIDYSRQNNRTALGVCPLRKAKVQLLPLRYGLVERLDPAAALSLPYQTTSRPMGIRLVRDGWLYVIDNTSGYLHEYRVENGEVSQFVWQGNEASQDHRQGMDTQKVLLFSRATTLHFAYSEVQWTANKCSKMIDSRPDRDHFMQCVDLSSADCVKGGPHLLTDAQAKQWLAEVAEPPSSITPAEGVHPQETQDYVWEDTPLFKKTPIAVVKRQMLAAYEYDHLYLVFNDTLGVMRDLAEEQDTVVGWIDEWVEWGKHFSANTLSLKENLIFAGAISGASASAMSVYQNVHISLIDKALKAVQINSQSTSGMLLEVKLGMLGLGLGFIIAPFAFVGALGTSLNNFNKWIAAIRTGSSGERAGAFLALAGDTGNSVTTGVWAVKTIAEIRQFIAARLQGTKAFSVVWTLGNSRYMIYTARLSPWMLGFMAVSLGGEAIYRYHNLDEHQRWLLNSCWGNEDQEWDWPTHAQRLAEATLQPIITDHGITQPENELDRFRTLSVSFPGMSVQALADHPIVFTAQWQRDSAAALQEVGEKVRKSCKFINNSPLTVQMNLPYEWCGNHALLLMRISVRPELAFAPLDNKKLFLHYRIPLDLGSVNASIKGVAGIPHIGAIEGYELKLEHLNE